MMNKKAQSGSIMSIAYFLFLLLIIILPILLIAKSVLGTNYDNRLSDASLFANIIKNCLRDNPEIKSVDFMETAHIESLCKVKFDGMKVILYVSANGNDIYGYGDKNACKLYDLNNKYPKCISVFQTGKLDGLNVEYEVFAGSNLEGVRNG